MNLQCQPVVVCQAAWTTKSQNSIRIGPLCTADLFFCYNQSMNEFENLAELDKHKIFDAIAEQPNHLQLNSADGMYDDLSKQDGDGIHNLVFAGMGGSALAANILKNWLYERIQIPFEVVRGSNVPGYVNNHTLVVISSYSGNTEETLSALEDARKRNANIVILSAGGELLKIAERENYPLLKLPHVSQPRLSVFAGLKALACMLEDLNLAGSTDLRRELEDVGNWLNEAKFAFSPDNNSDNPAQMVAKQLVGKPVVIYGTPATGSAAYKWKIDINENAKQLAWYNVYSELNHNEFQGWNFPKHKNLAVVQLASSFDSPMIRKRVEVTTKLLANHDFSSMLIDAQGTTPLQQLLYLVLYGDYVSAYLGILNGIDPTPVDMVEELKKELNE